MNFSCFDDHRVEFSQRSLIVGKNNAGKSTCTEALRLIGVVTDRQRGLQFKAPPPGIGLPPRFRGLQPAIEWTKLSPRQIFHRYGDPPAVIIAEFSSGCRIENYIDASLAAHAVIYNAKSEPVSSAYELARLEIPKISILPQVGPLTIEEVRLSEDYVRANLHASRASLHFRNQLNMFPEYFDDFNRMVEDTWPGLRIIELSVPLITQREDPFALLVQDHDFIAEVAMMGHGVQMWFLNRNRTSQIVILDEPDVYMHADLQRRLIRLLANDNRQFIIATHSPEMLSEVSAESVVILDRSQPVSSAATDSDAVQAILRHVGSVHNLTLARLGVHRKLLLVEGGDVSYLKLFQNALDPRAPVPVDAIPNVDVGGWAQWAAAIDIARLFRRSIGDKIKVFCLFDRDYFTDEVIEKRHAEAEDAGVTLKIWEGKEIENYVLMPEAIARLVSERSKKPISIEYVKRLISEEAKALRDETTDTYSEILRQQKKASNTRANPQARQIVKERWEKLGGHLVVSGKDLFRNVAAKLLDSHDVQITKESVIRAARPGDVHVEIKEFLRQLSQVAK